MPQTIKIYGSSDDLVEIEGKVTGCDEYDSYDEPTFIELSTGDVFKVEYISPGVWVIDHHIKSNKRLVVRKEPHGDGDDPAPYTDTVEVTGPIKWVDVWKEWPPTVGEKKEKVETAVEMGLGDELVERVYEMIRGR